eukprot:CAMPEP_0113477520 /NCGR_PEP_ID=MMETSP0014_2-20120614/20250_1 /TAXON_ID=2857 /ORGANISM="Nitzschia sp." /LENGTH=754 /DNA_ID=CAMNT_0000370617 /DNA_START=146 /DNA_END=2407 /DNA_ORIENTATION=- /assembly_acc=CAM_ASM_000159
MVQVQVQSKHYQGSSRLSLRPRPRPGTQKHGAAVVGAGKGGEGASSSRTAVAVAAGGGGGGAVADDDDDDDDVEMLSMPTTTRQPNDFFNDNNNNSKKRDYNSKDKDKDKTTKRTTNRPSSTTVLSRQKQRLVVAFVMILTTSFYVGYVYVAPIIIVLRKVVVDDGDDDAVGGTGTGGGAAAAGASAVTSKQNDRTTTTSSRLRREQQPEDYDTFASLLPPFPKVWRPNSRMGNNDDRHRHDGGDHATTTADSTTAAAATTTTSPMIILSDEVLEMCTETLWHTIETTTIVLPNGDTFVHTGDIDDLWVRDSAAQLHTLLVPTFGPEKTQSLASLDPQLRRVVRGLIRRVAMYIRHDPYANAFRIDDTYKFSEEQKRLGRHDLISTWNYELDSGCYYLRMIWFYWKFGGGEGGEGGHGDDAAASVLLQLQSVKDAVRIMVELWIAEQRHEQDEYPTGELFDCLNCNKPYNYPGLKRDGKGSKTNPDSGLTWTGFRPSDDECQYHFLIPANMFCVVVLGYVIEMASPEAGLWNDPELVEKAKRLRNDIQEGIQKYGVVDHPTHGKIYAYEVDGYGNYNLMDDANIPSLLSIPYIGYESDQPDGQTIYENTRRFILSTDNPTYHEATSRLTGTVIRGYGSPHVGIGAIRNNIWPMSIAMQGLTSSSMEEKLEIIDLLVEVSAGTHWMHESFDPSNPNKYTRSWFCWADSLFAELVTSVVAATEPKSSTTENRQQVCPLPSTKYSVMEWRDPTYVEG